MAVDLAERAALAVDNARLYQAEQEAVHVRDAFLAVASHELKGPLTPLALRLQALQRETLGPGPVDAERVRGHVKVLQRQTRRLATLVESLLDVSRIEAGTLQLDLEDVDLDAVVKDVVSRFEGQAARAHSALELAPGGPLVGRWDRVRLEQVVTHLLGNALKYGAGHPIHVHTSREGPWAKLLVRDEGIGIDARALSRIFGRFERAVPAEHFGGLGLGLFLSRSLVDGLGGAIHVESEPGRGASFEVRLPLSPGALSPVG
jgi:signal transduction histidine kinase